ATDLCQSSPCVNGTCENIENGYICKCQQDFTGQNCETHLCKGYPYWTFYEGDCFVCKGVEKTWHQARTDCQLEGADLVSITNAGIQSFVQSHCTTQYNWIGLNDIQTENHFVWLDSSNVSTFTNWSPSEPNDAAGEDCTQTRGASGQWNDLDCSNNLTFICQKSADTDECLSSPCGNGTCVDLFGTYKCICEAEFTGNNCDKDMNECRSSPCVHGSCVNLINEFECHCQPGFTGKRCEHDVNECQSSPCRYGNCTNLVNKYECNCYPGYRGANCETDIDECSSSPCLQGTCIDLANAYKCVCRQGYSGTNCEKDVNECLSSPCSHGQCVDKINSFTCDCQFGYVGTFCEE
ncbi:fibropellin-1-like, partial [Saccostrea cucullata]|uniref:fibropellin-1-like n=1 Tax=Saccostrea cuccullata TaxID=36930 RepID=UPI002ED66DB0